MMDEIDRKLLAILQDDATLSVVDMSERVGLSPTPCWRRIQKLEAAGVITRRVALLAPESIGMELTVFVAVQAADHTPEWLDQFSRAVTAMPVVMEVYRMAGEIDYILRVVAANVAEFDRFYKSLIRFVPMKNVTSHFAMERIKTTTAYPLHGSVFRDRGDPESRRTEEIRAAE